MPDGHVWIRPYRPQDRQEALSLAGRLQIGVAPWRDPDAVREAVVGWVRGSLDSCTAKIGRYSSQWMRPDSSAW